MKHREFRYYKGKVGGVFMNYEYTIERKNFRWITKWILEDYVINGPTSFSKTVARNKLFNEIRDSHFDLIGENKHEQFTT